MFFPKIQVIGFLGHDSSRDVKDDRRPASDCLGGHSSTRPGKQAVCMAQNHGHVPSGLLGQENEGDLGPVLYPFKFPESGFVLPAKGKQLTLGIRSIEGIDYFAVTIDPVSSGAKNISLQLIGEPIFGKKFSASRLNVRLVKGFPQEWTGNHGLFFRHPSFSGSLASLFEWAGKKIGVRVNPVSAEALPISQFTAKNDKLRLLVRNGIPGELKIPVIEVSMDT